MSISISRVLKAPTKPVTDFATLQPLLEAGGLYASDKEDGIRCITHPHYGVVSQKMLQIPNAHVQWIMNLHCPWHLDGELVAIDDMGNPKDFNDTQSAIMSEGGKPRFEFRVFDCFENIYDPYKIRKVLARDRVFEANDPHIKWLPHHLCRTIAEIEMREESALRRGKEGLMLNSPSGWYKEGRSTFKEGYLLKVKRFMDDEALVIGIEEEMENCNLATRDAGGLQKRSKHKAGLKGKGIVGKLVCIWKGKEMRIASGMTGLDKLLWFRHPELIVNKWVTFKYQLHGMKDLPRTPVYKGIRYA